MTTATIEQVSVRCLWCGKESPTQETPAPWCEACAVDPKFKAYQQRLLEGLRGPENAALRAALAPFRAEYWRHLTLYSEDWVEGRFRRAVVGAVDTALDSPGGDYVPRSELERARREALGWERDFNEALDEINRILPCDVADAPADRARAVVERMTTMRTRMQAWLKGRVCVYEGSATKPEDCYCGVCETRRILDIAAPTTPTR